MFGQFLVIKRHMAQSWVHFVAEPCRDGVRVGVLLETTLVSKLSMSWPACGGATDKERRRDGASSHEVHL